MIKLEQISIREWILKNKIRTESGQFLDFHNHRYLRQIYSDNAKYLCCLKAGQIGFSTMAILKTIWLAKNMGIDIGYILPTADMVNKFVGSKVNRMAQQNPVIESWMKDKDSITQKQIDENYIHYLGAMTDRSAIMISLDMLVADEYDKAPQEILEIYDSRLQHSKYGYKWVFSNPTIPEFGVSRFWNISDQKKWHITHSCGKKYVMDESCINFTSEIYQCPHCQGVITSEEIRMGEWIPTAKGEWSGYWIPLWINPMVTAEKICAHRRDKSKEYFYNFVAGLPYVNPNDALSQSTLESNLIPTINDRTYKTIIGLDTGHNLHYTMLNKQGIFYHGYCPSVEEMGGKAGYDPYDEIRKRLKDDPQSILVSDQGGDLIGIRKIQAEFPGRVFLCWFVKETRNKELIRWGDGEEFGKVLVDRNRMVQMVVDEFNDRRLAINGTKEDWQPWFNHWLNIYRVKEFIGEETDPQYGWRWVWKRKGADHWAMSTIYALVGAQKYAESNAIIIGEDVLGGLPTARIFDSSGNVWN
jgi:hypothetical protein